MPEHVRRALLLRCDLREIGAYCAVHVIFRQRLSAVIAKQRSVAGILASRLLTVPEGHIVLQFRYDLVAQRYDALLTALSRHLYLAAYKVHIAVTQRYYLSPSDSRAARIALPLTT